MFNDFKKQLGERIKEFRVAKNISRDELAFRAGVSGTYIGMIERAEYDFKLSKLFYIAKGLEIPLKELLDF